MEIQQNSPRSAIRRGVNKPRGQQTCIYQTDGQHHDAAPGLYAVKLGKGTLERALGVVRSGVFWTVYLDGKPLSVPETAWRPAFGHLFKNRVAFLYGRKLSANEYRELVKIRKLDVLNGLDLSRPVNLHSSRIAI